MRERKLGRHTVGIILFKECVPGGGTIIDIRYVSPDAIFGGVVYADVELGVFAEYFQSFLMSGALASALPLRPRRIRLSGVPKPFWKVVLKDQWNTRET